MKVDVKGRKEQGHQETQYTHTEKSPGRRPPNNNFPQIFTWIGYGHIACNLTNDQVNELEAATIYLVVSTMLS